MGRNDVVGGALAGLMLGLLSNPKLLLVIVIVAAVLLIAGVVTLAMYGLVTAVTFFLIGAIVLFILARTKSVDFNKHPYVALAPFIMGVAGYALERLQVFKVNPAWVQALSTAAASQSQADPKLLLLILLIVLLIIVACKRG